MARTFDFVSLFRIDLSGTDSVPHSPSSGHETQRFDQRFRHTLNVKLTKHHLSASSMIVWTDCPQPKHLPPTSIQSEQL